jgi:hypothetical protein
MSASGDILSVFHPELNLLGITVSNFVLPLYFTSSHERGVETDFLAQREFDLETGTAQHSRTDLEGLR